MSRGTLGNKQVELGAQWIHGRGDCPLWRFAIESGLDIAEDKCGDGDGVFLLPGGQEVPMDVLTKTLQFLEEIHTELDTIGAQPNPSISSVGEYYEDQFQKFLSPETDLATKELKTALYNWFVLWERADNAVETLHQQSVLSWAEYTEYDREGDNFDPTLVAGFTSLVSFLQDKIKDKVDIWMNEKVETINWNENGVLVETQTGKRVNGNLVIVTSSLGFLKQSHKKMFHPPLPSDKVEVIENLGFGVMDKIILEFERSFWDLENPGVQLVDTGSSLETEEDVSVSWVKSIPGFDSLPGPGMETTLWGWVVGQAALYMETLTEEQVGAACVERLRQFLGDRLPPLLHCTVTRWGSHPLFKGSYSYRPPVCDSLGIGPWTLAEPIMNRLLFSGEATDKHHYGTVTGAMQGCPPLSHHHKLGNPFILSIRPDYEKLTERSSYWQTHDGSQYRSILLKAMI